LFLWNVDLIFHSRQFGNDPKPFDGPELDFQVIITEICISGLGGTF
jgi:hypothetical protein